MEDHHEHINSLSYSNGFWKGYASFQGMKIELHLESECMEGPTYQQKKCIKLIESLSGIQRHTIRESAVAYFKLKEELIDFSEEGISIDCKEIEKHYSIELAFIPRLGTSSSNLYMLQGECDWEEELGFQVAFFEKELVYCGEIVAPSMSTHRWDSMLSSNTQFKDFKDLF